MKHTLALCCLLLLLRGYASAAPCDAIPGADSLYRPGVVVLLGEIHGTNESPATVARLVCGALAKGLHVTVGLELLVEDQVRIDRYMASGGSDEDRDSLIAGEFWQRDYQDGRGSQAMVSLIETLRQYKDDTSVSLNLIALDDPSASEGRDRFMADRILSAIGQDSSGFVITLTGNIHNRRTIGTHFDPDYEPMGYHVWLRSPESDVISLELVNDRGTAWVSTGSGRGVVDMGGEPGEPGISFYKNADEDAYQGRLHVGTISASLPAKDR